MAWKRNKYNARPAERQGRRFASQLEAKYFDKLNLLQKQGEIDFFLCQVPFHLPNGVKYVSDFMEFHSDGTVRIVDVKGMPPTALFITKKKLVEAHYPVSIEVVRKVD